MVVCDETGDLFDTLEHFSDDVELIHTRKRAETIEALQQAPAHAVLLNMRSLEELDSWTGAIPRESKGTSIIGCSVQHTLERARALGLIGQLIKPVTRSNLAQMMQRLTTPVKRVIVVDDGVDEIEMLSQMLWAYNEALEIMTARDGTEALQKLCASRSDPPDLMLLDIIMPGMDGWQVLEAIAGSDNLPTVPTFFVSAQDPYERPPRSSFMVVATEEGLSLTQLLRCSLAVSNFLLLPEGKSHPALE
jgi:CheY-like chemotaxis protein